jgi:O-antigen/teichoic acid export membrane protein
MPLGMDGIVNRIVLSAGVLNVTLAMVLAPRFAHVGMAVSVAVTETVVAIAMAVVAFKTTAFWGKAEVPTMAANRAEDHVSA